MNKRYPKNAPGPFYVEDEMCIICGAPHQVAPNLMGWFIDEKNSNEKSHCFFKRQPNTPEETKQPIEAITSSCCAALRYSGTDKEIIDELRKAGFGDMCDHG